jgi:hypothetical protein
MDSENNLSDSMFQSSEPISTSITSNYSSDEGFFSGFYKINATTWIIIVLILAFLGFNIFVYLAKGTQAITDFFAPLLEAIFGTTLAVAGQAVDVSAEGAKIVVGETASAINAGLTAIQDITPNPTVALSSVKGQPVDQQNTNIYSQGDQSTLNKALNTAQSKQTQQNDYEADYASSSIQGGGKTGWCYIGDDRGFRSCAQVGIDDACMSGDIFPSKEICMNPNLRP